MLRSGGSGVRRRGLHVALVLMGAAGCALAERRYASSIGGDAAARCAEKQSRVNADGGDAGRTEEVGGDAGRGSAARGAMAGAWGDGGESFPADGGPDDAGCFEPACDENASCRATEAGFACGCNSGYRGDGFICKNIDECQESTHGCGAKEVCRDTRGSYVCECKEGYVLNSGECVSRLTYIEFTPTAVNTDGTVVGGSDGEVAALWRRGEGASELKPQVDARVLSISADGDIVTAATMDAVVRWDGGDVIRREVEGWLGGVDASIDGGVVVGGVNHASVFVWDLSEDRPAYLIETGLSVAAAVSNDGDVVTGSVLETLDALEWAFRVNRRRPAEVEKLAFEGYSVTRSIDISADGEVIVGSAWNHDSREDAVAVRWKGEGAKELASPLGAEGGVEAVSASADGKRVVGARCTHANAIYWPSPNAVGVPLLSYADSIGVDVSSIEHLREVRISDDGKTIVGTAVRVSRAHESGFILRIP